MNPARPCAGGRPDLAGAADFGRVVAQVLHVRGRGQVRDRQVHRFEMHGDLPVREHEPHVAVGVLEPVGAGLHDVRPVPGGHHRVDEHRSRARPAPRTSGLSRKIRSNSRSTAAAGGLSSVATTCPRRSPAGPRPWPPPGPSRSRRRGRRPAPPSAGIPPGRSLRSPESRRASSGHPLTLLGARREFAGRRHWAGAGGGRDRRAPWPPRRRGFWEKPEGLQIHGDFRGRVRTASGVALKGPGTSAKRAIHGLRRPGGAPRGGRPDETGAAGRASQAHPARLGQRWVTAAYAAFAAYAAVAPSPPPG